MDIKNNKEEKKKTFFQLWMETLKLLKQCGTISPKNIEHRSSQHPNKDLWNVLQEVVLKTTYRNLSRIDEKRWSHQNIKLIRFI